jgi:hypothetical protein
MVGAGLFDRFGLGPLGGGVRQPRGEAIALLLGSFRGLGEACFLGV